MEVQGVLWGVGQEFEKKNKQILCDRARGFISLFTVGKCLPWVTQRKESNTIALRAVWAFQAHHLSPEHSVTNVVAGPGLE